MRTQFAVFPVTCAVLATLGRRTARALGRQTWHRPNRRTAVGVCALALLLTASAAGPATASRVETFVLSVGGQSAVGPQLQCATFGGATTGLNFFGAAGVETGVGVPTDGLAPCNIAGGFNTITAPVGPLSDSTSLSTVFNSFPPNSFTGSAAATAQYGTVGAKAHGEFTGPGNGLIVEGAEAYGLFRETGMAPVGLNVIPGTPGMARVRFTVDGSLSVNVPAPFSSTSDVEVVYQQGTGPHFTLMRAQVNDSISQPFISVPTAFGSQVGPGVFGGFTLAPGSVSGSGVFDTFDLPIVFGTPFDFTLGLLAYTIPGTGATNDADFFTTVQLTGIQLFAGGQPVTNFTITSDSGTVYGPNGVQLPVTTVPEPATLLLLSTGVLGVGLWRWQGGQRQRPTTPAYRA